MPTDLPPRRQQHPLVELLLTHERFYWTLWAVLAAMCLAGLVVAIVNNG